MRPLPRIALADRRALLIPPLVAGTTGLPKDVRGRGLSDLRISVTDRCNFRCNYCMPQEVFDETHPFLEQGELLSFEEILRVARIFHGQGVRKIRLTGGEPLLRKEIEKLITLLAQAMPDVVLTLTTNGTGLKAKAKALKEAGLTRLNVSLDTLDDTTFRAMNGVDYPVGKVLEAIDEATAAGFAPMKINMVVQRGVNDAHIVDMARHFKGSGNIVRFIEYMDVGSSNGWKMDDVVPSTEVVQRINAAFPCEPVHANYKGEVAKRWRYTDGSGEFGVISSVTEAFCGNCTRARLSTDGSVYTCLFAEQGYDLRSMLRGGKSDADIHDAIAAIWQHRTDRYSELRTAATTQQKKVEMSFIGG